MMKISLVAALAENNGIGKDNKLLWHLPNDLRFFKAYTLGKVIVMGRKTFESIGKRALPGRLNAVITKNPQEVETKEVLVFKTLDAALFHFKNTEEVCIVGGAQMYQETLPIADILVLTRVAACPQADVFFPEVDWNSWKLVSEEKHLKDEKHAFDYAFQVFEKRTI
jgi:dihydrofolate reductase